MRKVTTRAMSLSDEAIIKVDQIGRALGLTRSAVIERLLINSTVKTITRYAKKVPAYTEDKPED